MPERERIEVKRRDDIDYDTLDRVVKECGGWMRSSGPDGESAKIWHGDDKVYVFSGEGLIKFLYAIKDKHVRHLYAAVDTCEYIVKAEKQPPSVFVRDAIVARAQALKVLIEGGER